MQAISRRARRGDGGQSLVELAVVLVLLLLLLAGAVDFGRAFHSYIVITNAAREGARYASHFPHYADGIRAAVVDEAANSGVVLDPANDIMIVPEPPAGAQPGDVSVAQPGEPIRVLVEHDVSTFVSGVIGVSTITVRTGTEMVVFGLDKT
jgi:hypothetical protein